MSGNARDTQADPRVELVTQGNTNRNAKDSSEGVSVVSRPGLPAPSISILRTLPSVSSFQVVKTMARPSREKRGKNSKWSVCVVRRCGAPFGSSFT